MKGGGKTQILNRFEADLKAYLKIMHSIFRVTNIYESAFFIHTLTKLRANHPLLNESLLEVLVCGPVPFVPWRKLKLEKYFVNESS